MKDNMKMLEDRVQRTIERMRELNSERERLESELQRLQGRVEQLEAEAGSSAPAFDAALADRARIVAELQTAVAELRGD